MIEIHPNALYTRQDLIELLRPVGIDPDAFVARIRPNKRFRMAWWGADLIHAIEQAPTLGEPTETTPAPQKSRCRRGSKATDALLRPLQRLKEEAEGLVR